MADKRASIETLISNKWFLSTVALLVVFAIYISFPTDASGDSPNENALSSDAITNKMQGFIVQNLLPPGVSAKIANTTVESGVYKFAIELESGGETQEVTSYATQDGKFFFTQALDVDKVSAESSLASEESQNTSLKSEKPEVELYVMSFCPYGVQAEVAMKPVADMLGDKISLNVRFITKVAGDTPESVQSLHGAPEAQEDLRQACVMKYYGSSTFWNYLSEVNANCYGIYRDAAKLDACWKDAAQKAGIDTAKITACYNSTEGVNLLKADEAKGDEYGVRGSPTIIINGETYSGGRSADAYKEAICNAFTTPPAECDEEVQATGQENTPPPGSCG